MKPVPAARRSFFLAPFVPEGTSPGGVWISHHKSIPAIFGRVTAVHHTCRDVRVGDWVVFEAGRPVRLKWSGGRVFCLREQSLLGIVLPPDGLPWFQEEALPERNAPGKEAAA